MEREDFSFERASRGIGLYVHVPFCARHCRYCDFVVTTRTGAEEHARYAAAVGVESGFWQPHFAGRMFETLYFGGGTPSRLSAAEFHRMHETLRRNFEWTDVPEITLEANPDDVEPERLAAWRAAGVTRVSLGAQSFRDETLKLADRSHDAAQIETAVRRLRQTGFRNLSLDLILSMPGETVQDVRHSVECLLALNPEHVSLYELVIEPRTVFGKWYGADKRNRVGAIHELPLQLLPDENQQIKMLTTARAMLKKAGYRHYELLNFSKPGHESRHNLLYWANRETLGLGPGAFSYLGGRRFRLARTVDDYYRKIEGRHWAPSDEEILSADRREVESFLLALRLAEGASMDRFRGVIETKSREIQGLVDKDLITHDNTGVRMTERGKLFAETIFSELA